MGGEPCHLADNFIFSANNLQDYLDCPRRFELKYILKQNWPAITSQPVQEMENKILMGNRFHLLGPSISLGYIRRFSAEST